MFWNTGATTRRRGEFRGGGYHGDLGGPRTRRHFRFVGRDDDLITSWWLPHRPRQIEACLSHHPAVRWSLVVERADPIRTEVVRR